MKINEVKLMMEEVEKIEDEIKRIKNEIEGLGCFVEAKKEEFVSNINASGIHTHTNNQSLSINVNDKNDVIRININKYCKSEESKKIMYELFADIETVVLKAKEKAEKFIQAKTLLIEELKNTNITFVKQISKEE